MANRRGRALFGELNTADCRFFESCSVYFRPYSCAPCLARLFCLVPVSVEQGDKNDDAGGRLLAGNTGAFDRLRHPGAFPRFDFGSRGLYCSIGLFALGVLFCGDCRKQSAQPDTVSWIGILSVVTSLHLIFPLRNVWIQGGEIQEQYSGLNNLFWIMCYVLMIVGWFKFARSEAFAGNYNGSPGSERGLQPVEQICCRSIDFCGSDVCRVMLHVPLCRPFAPRSLKMNLENKEK